MNASDILNALRAADPWTLQDIADLLAAARILPRTDLPDIPASPVAEEEAPVAEVEAPAEVIPDASSYRVEPDTIKPELCQARRIVDKDRRWAPMIFKEGQCPRKPLGGTNLCRYCTQYLAKYEAEGHTHSNRWNGLITEEPLPHTHMLGTEWARKRQPKWNGTVAAAGAGTEADDFVSVASS
jgi:hypothetical protein